MVEIRGVRQGDIARFAYLLRDNDEMEIWLSHGARTYEVLQRCVEHSTRCYVATAGAPLALFGVVPVTAGVASVWLLGASGIDDNPIGYARACREFFPRLIDGFQFVENFVWEGYTAALRWAKWLGFEVESPQPFGPFGAPFCHIWKEA